MLIVVNINGEEQWRRTSKIKNGNLIFCGNKCRAKYVSKKSNQLIFSNKDIKKYLTLFQNRIKSIAANAAVSSGIPDILDDLIKEAPFVIYKCLQNTKQVEVRPYYFAKSYKNYLHNLILSLKYSDATASLDFYESPDKLIDLAYFDDYSTKIDDMDIVNKMLHDMSYLPISCQIALDGEVFNLNLINLVEKYSMTRRQVV